MPPEVPAHALFPQMLAVVQQFVTDRVQPEGRRETIDVFLDPFTWAVDALLDAIVPADSDVVELPRYEANRQPGSTRDVDFWARPVREAQHSPLNYLVMETQQWEQSAAFYLDTDAHVLAFVKNANLGFAIPYAYRGETREYIPNFLARAMNDAQEVGTLILETKGHDPAAAAKVEGAHRWVDAVNAEGSHGRWAYRIVTSPTDVPRAIGSALEELVNPPRADWRGALAAFVRELRGLYGDRLQQVVLYGSRARGTAERDSDIDTMVVLDSVQDFWREKERISCACGSSGGAACGAGGVMAWGRGGGEGREGAERARVDYAPRSSTLYTVAT